MEVIVRWWEGGSFGSLSFSASQTLAERTWTESLERTHSWDRCQGTCRGNSQGRHKNMSYSYWPSCLMCNSLLSCAWADCSSVELWLDSWVWWGISWNRVFQTFCYQALYSYLEICQDCELSIVCILALYIVTSSSASERNRHQVKITWMDFYSELWLYRICFSLLTSLHLCCQQYSTDWRFYHGN